MATTRLPSEEGVIQNVSHHASLSPGAGAWILAATIPGTSLYYIDSNVVNIALPALQRDLHATAAAVQWVFEAYTLLLSALILVGGRSAMRWGDGASPRARGLRRRRFHLLSVPLCV